MQVDGEDRVRGLPRSPGCRGGDPLRGAYKLGFTKLLSWKGFAVTDHFGDISAFLALPPAVAHAPGTYEIMIHPGYSQTGELIDAIKGYHTRSMLERLSHDFAITPLQ